jgi:hypothetical protein
MITQGFTFSYSDLVTLDTNIPYVSSYIYIPSGSVGDVVFEAPDGTAQWVKGAPAGYSPISATRVLTSGTVNGTPRTTTASNMVYCCAPTY